MLTQRRIPANLTFAALIVPDLFTLAPSYLPDAPFINRLYGESSFNTFSVGAKWRWTSTHNPLGVGIIPFYRFYADHADDFNRKPEIATDEHGQTKSGAEWPRMNADECG